MAPVSPCWLGLRVSSAEVPGRPRAAGPKDCTKGTRLGALGADGPELRGTDVTGLYLLYLRHIHKGRLGACECVDGPNGSVTETVPCKTASYRHLMIVRLCHIPPMCPTVYRHCHLPPTPSVTSRPHVRLNLDATLPSGRRQS